MGSFQNVASNLTAGDPIVKASIVPRGVDALGHTIQRPSEDRVLLAESELKNRIAVLMGGRAAESLVFEGNVSTGDADDLQCALSRWSRGTEWTRKWAKEPTLQYGKTSYWVSLPSAFMLSKRRTGSFLFSVYLSPNWRVSKN
jgi:hypothetical protein